jgi:hypothetical protein
MAYLEMFMPQYKQHNFQMPHSTFASFCREWGITKGDLFEAGCPQDNIIPSQLERKMIDQNKSHVGRLQYLQLFCQ